MLKGPCECHLHTGNAAWCVSENQRWPLCSDTALRLDLPWKFPWTDSDHGHGSPWALPTLSCWTLGFVYMLVL